MQQRSSKRRLLGSLLLTLGMVILIVTGLVVAGEQIRRRETLTQLQTVQPEPRFPTVTQTIVATVELTATHAAIPTIVTTMITPAPPTTAGATQAPSQTVETLAPTLTPTEIHPTATQLPPTATPKATSTPLPVPTVTRVPARITRIQSPVIGMEASVVEVGWVLTEESGKMQSVWQTASYAAGHHLNSALPGQDNNIVLSGHHNIEGEVFRHLVDLKVGDEVTLETEDGQVFVYQIIDTMILAEAGVGDEQRRANARYIAPTTDERLTLVTCWPYWTNTHRVIVVARPVSP